MISVGIDVSKGKSTVCILKPGGEVVKPPFEMEHAVENLDSLVSLINSFDEETRVVLEDTGHYHIPVARFLIVNAYAIEAPTFPVPTIATFLLCSVVKSIIDVN